jgi:Flp pilus assembly pilin Flp
MADMKTTYIIDTQTKGANKIKGLERGLKGVSSQTNKTAAAMARLKGAAGGALGSLRGLLPVLGVAGIAKFGNDVLQLGDKLQKMSEKTGASVPMLDKLRQASNLAGTDFNALTRLFPMLSKNIVQFAEKGTGVAADAFQKLGINVRDSNGQIRASEDVLLDIADKFKTMENGTVKADLAYKLFGARVGADLIPLLNQGSEAINKLNTGFTQENAEKMAAFNDRVSQLGERFREVAVDMTTSLLPALDAVVSILGVGAKIFNLIPGPIRGIAVAFAAVAVPLLVIVPILPAFVAGFKALSALKLGAVLIGWVKGFAGLSIAIKGIGIAMAATLGPIALPALIAAGVVAGLAVIWKFRDNIWKAFVWLGTKIKDMWTSLGHFFAGPFVAGATAVKNVWTGLINWIKGVLDRAFGWINKLVQQIKKVTSLGRSSRGRATATRAMAAGGVLDGPELVLAGEAGREYIIPEGKMSAASKNWLSGKRGGAVIPAFAQGGVVGSSGSTGGAPNIHIQTGPVLQQQGQQFVTLSDLEGALQTFSKSVFGNSRTTGGRRFQGVH